MFHQSFFIYVQFPHVSKFFIIFFIVSTFFHFFILSFFSLDIFFHFCILAFSIFLIVLCFSKLLCFIVFCFFSLLLFFCFFQFFLFLCFSIFHVSSSFSSSFFLFPIVRADAKTRKKSSRSSALVKRTTFFSEISFLGLGGQGVWE